MIRVLASPLVVSAFILTSCSSSPTVDSPMSESQYVDPAGWFRATLRPGWEVQPKERGAVQFINPKSRGAITLIVSELPTAVGASAEEWKPLMSFEASEVAFAGPGRSVRRWTGRHGPAMVIALYEYDEAMAASAKREADAILASIEFSGRGSKK